MVPFACFSSLMGCGVSKHDIAEDIGPPHKLRPVGVPGDYCVVPQPSPECGGRGGGGEHAKWDNDQQQNVTKMKKKKKKKTKKVNGGEIGGIHRENVQEEDQACYKEERFDRDDATLYPPSPSFKDFCISSLSDDDNSTDEDDSNAGEIKDKQQGHVQHRKKGSRTRLMKGGSRIGKGLRTGSAKVKSILKV